ncbi:MAG TPA: 4-alpha-glucanotransferase, partial [Rhodopila sp.]
IAFLAPDPRLAPGGWPEVRAAVDALHAAGLNVILDAVLNHSGESDELGPTLSLRGLDNAGYYRLAADRSLYVNDAGCGNILAMDRPAVVRLGLDALRAWALYGGMDGFRLDLATTLARREAGFDRDAPFLTAVEQDPVLSGCVMIAEPWDIGPGGYQLGAFPARWGEWNDRFRNSVRRFWRGDAGMLGELATRFAGSADIFAGRPLSRSINYVVAHDGFTLADLVAYNTKHNLENGEDNRDGTNDNLSWNNGVEGPSLDPGILTARECDVRALLATLLLSRGTPMLSMGDELGRTQHGNNNAYAQDNAGSWIDWSAANEALIDYTAALITLRRSLAPLFDGCELRGRPADGETLPDVTWHSADGQIMTAADWDRASNSTLIAVLYAADVRAALVLHAGRSTMEIVLPEPRARHDWWRVLGSAHTGQGLAIAGRSVTVFRERETAPAEASGTRSTPSDSPRSSAPTTSQDATTASAQIPGDPLPAGSSASGLFPAGSSAVAPSAAAPSVVAPSAAGVSPSAAVTLPSAMATSPSASAASRSAIPGPSSSGTSTDTGAARPSYVVTQAPAASRSEPTARAEDLPAGGNPATTGADGLFAAGERIIAGPRTGVTDADLDHLAELAGIDPIWWDVDGGYHKVNIDTKRALLTAMRLPAGTRADFNDSLGRLRLEPALPSVVTARAEHAIPVRPGQPHPAWVTLVREDGSLERFNAHDGYFVLPPQPIGRHRLLNEDRPENPCHLTVAPDTCYLPPSLLAGERRFGIATHLYSLRSDGDQGIGDFTTLARLAREAARAGAAVVGLNPLHALFPHDRARVSPYQPSDRRFLDPIYIDVSGLPGGAGVPSPLGAVDYQSAWKLKRAALQAAFRPGNPEATSPALQRFATFEAIAEVLGTSDWTHWPAELRHPDNPGVAAFAAQHSETVEFHAFLQRMADQQLADAAASASRDGLSLGLYRDLAVGAAPDGAEAWSAQDTLMRGVSVGAPPDPFSAQGQIWCLPPPDPFAMRREGYAGFQQLLVANMRHAGALRIDHVLGLRRLFIVPDGALGKDGAYVTYPMTDLLAQVALESQRARCLVVGEDLGTVPEGMSDSLAACNILSYSVLWFQRRDDRIRPPAEWRRLAAA